ncbi:MFS transporter [Novosphingobium sp. Gsoil 351]|uniref:MFS transporter n=1 Tax=Novosphingobium sp. Gsoil 351 TaxID=2675225 RepID=UPI0012B503E7|nr:MFS transporter [Novosphingobium sp. Gsoil 351]QGN54512.1 MFS transporter [Novosphingobium sp. Gsoil 351]
MTAPVAGGAGPAERIRAEDIPASLRCGAFGFLMIAEFFYGWAWNTVDFLRPQIRESLGLTLTEAGSAYTAQSSGALVGALVLAQLADHFGRRRTLFWVIAGYAITGAAGALVTSFGLLLLQRFVLGFFLGAIFPVLIGTYMGLFPSTLRGKLAALGNGTYNLSVVALGYALAWTTSIDWRVLLWAGALVPFAIAPLVFVAVPDDRKMIPWGTEGDLARPHKLPMTELFSVALRGNTLLLFTLVALNFFSYQAFAGWVTTYLKDVRGFAAEVYGPIAAWQFWGALIGGFFWGAFSDRYGRRTGAAGFFGAGVAILFYLYVLHSPEQLRWAGFAWGFMLSAQVAWAPWMSELFPAHLRSTAMSIFNWGRIVSMTAPLVTGAIAETFGLTWAMTLGAAGFAAGGLVWLRLPETVKR